MYTQPTTQHHGTAPPRPHQPWSRLHLTRGLPVEAPRGTGNLRLARGPLSRALRGASARGKLCLARVSPRQTRAAAQPPDGTGTFIANHSAEWEGSQTALAGVGHHAAQQT